MRLLILGGTSFLGRHLVDAAEACGHHVTLFNRGRTNPGLYPHVESLRGDRQGDLSALHGRSWDAVIDTSGYVPRVVRRSAEALRAAAERYVFISSISVYADTSQAGLNEDSPVGTLEDPATEQVTGETYGPLKALCEQEARDAFAGRALVIRPGLIVGPYDPSDRFTYWPVRVSQGGEVLAPGSPGNLVQFIDARDLAEWIVTMLEQDATGTYNATGPAHPLVMGSLLDACAAAADTDVAFTWVDERFLLDQGVSPWTELPLWVPSSDPQAAGMDSVDCSRALAAGLRFRPLDHTIRSTLEWADERPVDYEWRAGLAPSKEGDLLRLWHQRRGLA